MSKWSRCGIDYYTALPAKAGVYVILQGKRKRTVLYVGQSTNVRDRFRGYRIRMMADGTYVTPWGQFANLTLKFSLSRRFGDWAMRELRLIRRLQPALNCVGTPRRFRSGAA